MKNHVSHIEKLQHYKNKPWITDKMDHLYNLNCAPLKTGLSESPWLCVLKDKRAGVYLTYSYLHVSNSILFPNTHATNAFNGP